MGKKNPILGIGLLAGGALIASQMMQTGDAEPAPKNALGFTGSDELSLEDAIKKVIKGDKDLQRLLKGETGTPGAAGATGATGPQGLAGEQIKAFGGSIVKNSALELNSMEGWTISTGGTLTANDVYEGLLVLSGTLTGAGGITNNNKFYVDNRRLLKLTCFSMSSGATYRFMLRRFNKDNATIMHSSDHNVYALGNPSFNNTTMAKQTVYFGGIGTTTTSIGLNTAQGIVLIGGDTAGTIQVNHLVLQYVSLGEPVPYNLAFLPAGQVVCDPTTGALGYYNGTAVVW